LEGGGSSGKGVDEIGGACEEGGDLPRPRDYPAVINRSGGVFWGEGCGDGPACPQRGCVATCYRQRT